MAGIDLGDAWADGVWESGVWADGVWAGQEAAGGGGAVKAQNAANQHARRFGFFARLIRGLRIIVFLALGAL